jgi:hypothetical protein
MTPPPPPIPRFDHFPRHDELSDLLRNYAAAFPDLVYLASIGKSYEGRDIWVVTVTNVKTGEHQSKPAFWADGNIHCSTWLTIMAPTRKSLTC